jgi:hypothetical protein
MVLIDPNSYAGYNDWNQHAYVNGTYVIATFLPDFSVRIGHILLLVTAIERKVVLLLISLCHLIKELFTKNR